MTSSDNKLLSEIENAYSLDQLLWMRRYARLEIAQDKNVDYVVGAVMSSFKNLFDMKAQAADVIIPCTVNWCSLGGWKRNFESACYLPRLAKSAYEKTWMDLSGGFHTHHHFGQAQRALHRRFRRGQKEALY